MGTGSGKTNCFLIPVINELLREKEKGQLNDGVRAIFIYPMNALATDQAGRIAEFLFEHLPKAVKEEEIMIQYKNILFCSDFSAEATARGVSTILRELV